MPMSPAFLGNYVTERRPITKVKVNRLFSLEEEFEDTKGVIRICKLKYRQHNSQKKKDKQRSTKYLVLFWGKKVVHKETK